MCLSFSSFCLRLNSCESSLLTYFYVLVAVFISSSLRVFKGTWIFSAAIKDVVRCSYICHYGTWVNLNQFKDNEVFFLEV